MTSEDPHAITSAPASRRSCSATFAVADRHRRALPAMAGYRVGDAVRVQACGRFRPARIVRATAVTPRIVSLGRSQICAAMRGCPRSRTALSPSATRCAGSPPTSSSVTGRRCRASSAGRCTSSDLIRLPNYPHPWLPDRRTSPNATYFQSVTRSLQKVSMIYPAIALFQSLSLRALISGKSDRTVRNTGVGGCFGDLCTGLSTNMVDIMVSPPPSPDAPRGYRGRAAPWLQIGTEPEPR